MYVKPQIVWQKLIIIKKLNLQSKSSKLSLSLGFKNLQKTFIKTIPFYEKKTKITYTFEYIIEKNDMYIVQPVSKHS